MLVAKDIMGCTDTATDCGLVVDPLIYIPSAFSPNGDLKNDVFRPVSRHVTIVDFTVYNRYGQRIFISYDGQRGWDGTFNDEPCDLDVYFYTVHYQVLNREPQMLKGDVTLVR
jgi:gliding motility-associated-like protein